MTESLKQRRRAVIEHHLREHRGVHRPKCVDLGSEATAHSAEPVFYYRKRYWCPECYAWEAIIQFYSKAVAMEID